MKKTPLVKTLKTVVDEIGPSKVAEKLNCTPAAITKATESNRKVFVYVYADGTLKGEEIRPFPSPHHIKKTAA